jgi:hypothetical protein
VSVETSQAYTIHPHDSSTPPRAFFLSSLVLFYIHILLYCMFLLYSSARDDMYVSHASLSIVLAFRFILFFCCSCDLHGASLITCTTEVQRDLQFLAMNLWNLPRTEEEAVAFLEERGILLGERKCENSHPMVLYFRQEIFWKWNIKVCMQKVNMRVGNWFENTRLPFVTAVRFFYNWAFELTSIEWCKRELEMNKNTVIDWNNYLSEACVAILDGQGSRKIGGDELIVEIDESVFTKRKNNADRVLPV